MNVFIKTILISFIFINMAFSQIITTDSIDVLKFELEKADIDTFVIFDCDDTLLYKSDSILNKDNADKLRRYIKFAFIKHPWSYFYMDRLKWIVMKNCNQKLVHKDFVNLVAKLQSKNIKVLVLTAMINKTINEGSFVDLRINELYTFGFDFSKNWNNLKETALIEGNKTQYYKKGIICSGHGTKSSALKLFLKYSKFYPKKIIFIDDMKSNLDDIKTFSEESGIEFLGIEYLGYKKIPSKYPFSEKRAIFQIGYLIKNEYWLSDEKAELKLKDKKRNYLKYFISP